MQKKKGKEHKTNETKSKIVNFNSTTSVIIFRANGQNKLNKNRRLSD